jgi:hypothetical protein
MTLIEHIEVTAASQASITFSSIPTDGTYTDLLVVASFRGTRPSVFNMIGIEFNGSSANLSSRILNGDGASATSFSQTDLDDAASTGNTATANTFGSTTFYIPNYASSNAKSVSVDSVSENNATTAYQTLTAGLWNSTAAINEVRLFVRAGYNILQYSSATLYGITAGSDGTTTVS